MTFAARLARLALAALAVWGLVSGSGFARAADTDPGVAGVAGSVSPVGALPGEHAIVQSTGWPAYAQVQGVVCGNLGVGGSNACDQSTGQLGAADKDGRLYLDLIVGDPPKPCPCIVRVATYSGAPITLDLPFTVVGHRVGTPPKVAGPEADVVVTDVRVKAHGGVASLFGGGQDASVIVTLYNRGNLVATNPSIKVGVGKSDDLEPTDVTVTDAVIEPLQSVDVTIDARLPAGTFGSYFAVATTSGDADAPLRTAMGHSYPWGLFALNLIGFLAIGWAVWRRRTAGKRRERADALLRLEGRAYPLPDVVYVESLGGFLLSPAAAKRAHVLSRVKGRVEVEDLVPLAESAPGTVRPPAETASRS